MFHAAAGALRLKALRWLLERKPRPKEATGAVVVKNTAHHTAADVLDLVSGELQRLEAAAKAAAGGQSGGAKKPAKPKTGKEGKKAKAAAPGTSPSGSPARTRGCSSARARSFRA